MPDQLYYQGGKNEERVITVSGNDPKTPDSKKRSRTRTLIYYLSFPLVIYILLMIFFAGCQSKFMYHPTREIQFTPESVGLEYEDVFIKIADNITINGWYIPAKAPRGTILFFHGNGGNISHRVGSIKIFHDLNVNVFIIDYEGYGRSDGSPGEKQTYRDGEAAWKYLLDEKKIDPNRIVIFGRSMGGAIASYLAEKVKPVGLIMESSFTSAPDMASDMLPWMLFARYFCFYDYNSLKRVPDITCPKLMLHSPEDEIIPYKHGKRLFEAAVNPKTFFEMQGSHNSGYAETPGYSKTLGEFLDSVLK